jgi:type I restriction enzyme R subunit
MSNVGQKERETQNRVVAFFQDRLNYEYGGNLEDQDNTNINEALLRQNLLARKIDEELVNRAIQQLLTAASLGSGQSLYDANRKVYDLLRYGVKVKKDVGQNFETVWLIDWDDPDANHFVVAEEVTVKGEHTKRPDIVLYVNGIALGVIELKRSYKHLSDGIRQNIGNQKQTFVRSFFTTVQLLFAGNDVEGLRYAVIDTPEKYWLEWKEAKTSQLGTDVANPLDRAITQTCSKDRFLEFIHDFIVFDAGTNPGLS